MGNQIKDIEFKQGWIQDSPQRGRQPSGCVCACGGGKVEVVHNFAKFSDLHEDILTQYATVLCLMYYLLTSKLHASVAQISCLLQLLPKFSNEQRSNYRVHTVKLRKRGRLSKVLTRSRFSITNIVETPSWFCCQVYLA